MDERSTISLARFCAQQWQRFDARAWHLRAEADGARLADTARYLSMTSWYGYEEELARLSAELFAKIDRPGAAKGISSMPAFSLAELSFATRYLIRAYLLEMETAGSSSAHARMTPFSISVW